MAFNGPDWAISPLAEHHDRTGFTCGDAALDRYLREQAGQDQRRHLAHPYVLTAGGQPPVEGFYTLSAHVVALAELPAKQTRRLSAYPDIPATLLGRLAVAATHQGKGLGAWLLRDALRRALAGAGTVASHCVIVDAAPAAVAFYRHFGFIPLTDRPDRLFLPMDTIRKALP